MLGLFLWIAVFMLFGIIGMVGATLFAKLTKDDSDGVIFAVLLFAFCATELLFNSGMF